MNIKKVSFLTIFFLIMSINLIAFADSNEVKVFIEGDEVVIPEGEPKPFLNQDNRTMVTVRFISEALGYDVDWNNEERKATVATEDIMIVIPIDTNYALLNGQKIVFDTKSVIIQGRTFVPLRFVSEALGCQVTWDGSAHIKLPK